MKKTTLVTITQRLNPNEIGAAPKAACLVRTVRSE